MPSAAKGGCVEAAVKNHAVGARMFLLYSCCICCIGRVSKTSHHMSTRQMTHIRNLQLRARCKLDNLASTSTVSHSPLSPSYRWLMTIMRIVGLRKSVNARLTVQPRTESLCAGPPGLRFGSPVPSIKKDGPQIQRDGLCRNTAGENGGAERASAPGHRARRVLSIGSSRSGNHTAGLNQDIAKAKANLVVARATRISCELS